MIRSRALSLLAAAATLAVAAPVMAELNAGYEAWNRGDYKAAVREWRDLAAEGNADAQFNMAQAYRLGRGVEQNSKQAEILIAKAAAQGHIKATDTYGLLLFQSGRREEAMPYIIKAAERGNPRAQYLLGIGHFNGDLVGKDWVRAYALMTLSNSAGFAQAKPAITQMDDFIPLAQRQEAQVLAQKLKRDANTTLAQQIASDELGVTVKPAASASPPRQASASARSPLPSSVTRIPEPIQSMRVPPSVAAAQTAVAEAARVTGTESPARAGADFVVPTQATPAPARTAPVRTAQVAADPNPPAPRRVAANSASANGPWRVQLGAFGVRSNADRLWSRLSDNAVLSGKQKFVVPAGRVVKLQAGGYPSRSSAQNACNTLKRSGQDCLVTR
ncbi:SPOR domain-containing protein [Pontixanthobacter aestiaquae]|uniref:Sporulation protein n=1 Tax=Pontixanthobacter aestiaquae TaxID=1509367 RepID=A0A844Z6A9_9SPHN|nr:SPOR domain-containing protein [Pontixanthobacter aestiaquae]MDN3646156.1 SPOR domain-containing protein [Pontixanthobacter aestiaquae]MXO82852.1 sporulation protein [Pontixanthobacter aestiaquae]